MEMASIGSFIITIESPFCGPPRPMWKCTLTYAYPGDLHTQELMILHTSEQNAIDQMRSVFTKGLDHLSDPIDGLCWTRLQPEWLLRARVERYVG